MKSPQGAGDRWGIGSYQGRPGGVRSPGGVLGGLLGGAPEGAGGAGEGALSPECSRRLLCEAHRVAAPLLPAAAYHRLLPFWT